MATVLGILFLVFGASAVMVELRDTLNIIWHVPAPASMLKPSQFCSTGGRTVLPVWIDRWGVGFLLLVSLALNAAISAVGSLFGSQLPVSESILRLAVFLISFLVTTFTVPTLPFTNSCPDTD